MPGSSWGDWHPLDIEAALGAQGIFVWDGNTYALAVTKRLGPEGMGGVARLAAVHASTLQETGRLSAILWAMA